MLSTFLIAPLTVISNFLSCILFGSMMVLPYMNSDMQHALNILNLAPGIIACFARMFYFRVGCV